MYQLLTYPHENQQLFIQLPPNHEEDPNAQELIAKVQELKQLKKQTPQEITS
ncbi:MAG: hypothetical protein AB4372_37550 [Xenococcus sp. (in: cyanobacteria)]